MTITSPSPVETTQENPGGSMTAQWMTGGRVGGRTTGRPPRSQSHNCILWNTVDSEGTTIADLSSPNSQWSTIHRPNNNYKLLIDKNTEEEVGTA